MNEINHPSKIKLQ